MEGRTFTNSQLSHALRTSLEVVLALHQRVSALERGEQSPLEPTYVAGLVADIQELCHALEGR